MQDELMKLDHTFIKDRINQIIKIYERLQKKQKKFYEAFDIHCKNGCSACCEHFTPDISEVEALFLAYGLLKEGIDQEILKQIIL